MNHPLSKITLLTVIYLLCCQHGYAATNVLGQEILDSPRENTSEKTTSKQNEPNVTNQSVDSKSTNTPLNLPTQDNDVQDNAIILDRNIPANETATESPAVINIGSDDLWVRIKKGYAMPTCKSNLVANHERFFSSKPEYVKRMVERSQKYLFHIVEEVEKRDMPTEIALLPMIESAYNPQAYSRSRASGIWQFMPDTGRYFGLKQNWWVDNRRDVTIATDAALTYLQKLHDMFDSWDLALAAYNAGEGTVARAIAQNRKLGLSTDYESLNLPAETKNYVPKLQAMKNLMTYPEKYGLKIQTIANTAYFTRVTAPSQIDAHLAAKLAEISDAE
ncbi:MAG: transglycosylase SLT domain-containing protein, partial [Methylophilaceae bacterium]